MIHISETEAIKIADLGSEALEIVSKSPMSKYRKTQPGRARKTARLLNDAFADVSSLGTKLVEVGPGLYQFALIARHLGATTVCIEQEHAHAELGRHLGFEVWEDDFFSLDAKLAADGIWMKNLQYRGSYDEASLRVFAQRVTNMLNEGGWGLIVLRNGGHDYSDDDIPLELQAQKKAFEECGWSALRLNAPLRERWGLKIKGAPWLFYRNLPGLHTSTDRHRQ